MVVNGRILPAFWRRLVLTTHIIVSVGLLGDSAGYLAVAVRAASTSDPALARASYQTLEMFAFVFGIPLSFSRWARASFSASGPSGACCVTRGS